MSSDTTILNCQNCQAKLIEGVFKSVTLIPQNEANIINFYAKEKKSNYCTKCSKDLFKEAMDKLNQEKKSLKNILEDKIDNIPLLSINSPLDWDYNALGLITGQTTTGTGVISEFTSSFTDFFGGQSGAYNKKLAGGEKRCFTQVRTKCIELGGNAVLATDIDYAEVGGAKGMLMVAVTGTAVLLKNVEILGKQQSEAIVLVSESNKKLTILNKFKLTPY